VQNGIATCAKKRGGGLKSWRSIDEVECKCGNETGRAGGRQPSDPPLCPELEVTDGPSLSHQK